MKKISIFILTLVLAFSMSMCVFASGNYSYNFNGIEYSVAYGVHSFDYNIQDYINENGGNAFLFKVGGSNYLFVSDCKFYSNGINLVSEGDGTVHQLVYYVSGTDYYDQYWQKQKSFDVSKTGTINGYSVDNLIWASRDVKDSSGNVILKGDENFRIPLSEIILGVAEEELKLKLPTLAGTMKILAVCGVGLMALLISLPLLVKVLNRFLP